MFVMSLETTPDQLVLCCKPSIAGQCFVFWGALAPMIYNSKAITLYCDTGFVTVGPEFSAMLYF